MANIIYNKALEDFLAGNIGWSSDNIKTVLVDAGQYTASAAHQSLADIPAAARVATSGNLTSKTVTNGVADAADVTFAQVTGPSVEAIAIYKDTGTASSSRLIAYIDSGGAGLPVTPNGGDITFQWSNGANRIFRL